MMSRQSNMGLKLQKKGQSNVSLGGLESGGGSAKGGGVRAGLRSPAAELELELADLGHVIALYGLQVPRMGHAPSPDAMDTPETRKENGIGANGKPFGLTNWKQIIKTWKRIVLRAKLCQALRHSKVA